jgi:hypothetical protein
MTNYTTKMSFHVASRRVDSHGSVPLWKQAEIALDTDLAGNENVKKYGTVSNTVAPGTDLRGVLRRR